jgi:hypothetical protein
MPALSSRMWCVSFLFLAIVIGTSGKVVAQNDPAAQFSAVSNPAPANGGLWSYGFENFPLPNPFNVAPLPLAIPPGPIDSWQTPSFGQVGVFHNGTAAPQPYVTASDGAVYQPGEIGMHPGPNDQYGVIQFTATTPGLYSIEGTFVGLDTSGLTNTLVDLLYNNVPVKSGNAVGFVPVPLSAGPFFLNAGDTLAYAVGGNPVFGSTGLVPGSAMVAAVPEPSSLSLILMGTLGELGWTIRNRANKKAALR